MDFYFCCECKKHVESVEALVFVEENSNRGFCSNECIEDFYYPIVKFFENYEHDIRISLGITQEKLGVANTRDISAMIVGSPSEVFKYENELGESIHIFIKDLHDHYGIVVGLVCNREVSFVYACVFSNSQDLIDCYRLGRQIAIDRYRIPLKAKKEEKKEEIEKERGETIMEEGRERNELIESLEYKKSKFLADLLMRVGPEDIQFENYFHFEDAFAETIQRPDEVFEERDEEGDILFIYIKTFAKNMHAKSDYYYIVSCLKYKKANGEFEIYPVLAFPTIDLEICNQYRSGKKVSLHPTN